MAVDTFALPLVADADPACCAPLPAPPLDAGSAQELAVRFKALADPTRLQLLALVVAAGSACICDLTQPVGLSQPTVSHHMKVLVDAGLLRREKRGRWVHFSVIPGALRELAERLEDPGSSLGGSADAAPGSGSGRP